MGEVCDSPVRREVRYDRQLRLWGEHGQCGLESAHVLVCGVNTTTTEMAKNLILPGIGAITLQDDQKIEQSDLLSNFFYGADSKGQNRAVVACELLAELNPSVKCAFEERSVEFLLQEEPDFFAKFTLIIASRLVSTQLEILRRLDVPIISIESFGMFGRIRIFNQEHCLFESHPDNTIPDVRLDRPFPELVKFCESFNLESLSDKDHKHVPYLVPLYQALKVWRNQNGRMPSSFKEKKEVREIFQKMDRPKNDTENFDEGFKACIKLLRETTVPSSVRDLLKHPKVSNITPESDIFWCLLRALDFYLSDPSSEEMLPLRPQLPDMTADSKNYINLTRIYHERAQRDLERFTQKLDDVCRSANIQMPDDGLIQRFCNNIPNIRGNFYDIESVSVLTQHDELIDYNDYLQDPDSLCALNLIFDAVIQFNQENCRYPGTCQTDDVDKSAVFEILLKDSSLPRSTNYYDGFVQEIMRSGSMELHSVASYLGGIGAQEAIKLMTKQYVPIDNCLFYSAISQSVQVHRL